MPHRTPKVPVAKLEGNLPTVPFEEGEDARDIQAGAKSIIDKLNSAVKAKEFTSSFADLLLEDSWYKDQLTLTFNKRTFHYRQRIVDVWQKLAPACGAKDFAVADPAQWGPVMWLRMSPTLAYLNVPITFTTATPPAKCAGIVKLLPDKESKEGWKIWSIYTTLVELIEKPFQKLPLSRPLAEDPVERGIPEAHGLPPSSPVYDAVVIGGGNAGLSAIAYLESAGLNAVLIEKLSKIGELWLSRYSALRLHTPKHFSRLPLEDYPEDFPTYVPAPQLAQFYADYVKKLQLPVYSNSTAQNAKFDPQEKVWTVDIASSSGEGAASPSVQIRTRNLIVATGHYCGKPIFPKVPGQETFKGIAMHSAQYTDSSAYKGKKAVIVGLGPSGSDIAWDLVQHGAASVKMVQRGAKGVFKVDALEQLLAPLYNDQVPAHVADLNFFSDPLPVTHKMVNPALRMTNEKLHPGLLDALEEKGYKVKRDLDLIEHIWERHGGLFQDERGLLDLILQGKVVMEAGTPAKFTEHSLVLDTGKELEADLVVFATGSDTQSIPDRLVSNGLIEQSTADKLENVMFGVNKEGEMAGMWTFSGHENFYFAGFEFPTARMSAPLIAAQVALDVTGPLPSRYDQE